MIVLGVDVSKLKLDAALWLPQTRKWYALRADNSGRGAQAAALGPGQVWCAGR